MKDVYIIAIFEGSKVIDTRIIEAFTEVEAMKQAEKLIDVTKKQEYSLELYI